MAKSQKSKATAKSLDSRLRSSLEMTPHNLICEIRVSPLCFENLGIVHTNPAMAYCVDCIHGNNFVVHRLCRSYVGGFPGKTISTYNCGHVGRENIPACRCSGINSMCIHARLWCLGDEWKEVGDVGEVRDGVLLEHGVRTAHYARAQTTLRANCMRGLGLRTDGLHSFRVCGFSLVTRRSRTTGLSIGYGVDHGSGGECNVGAVGEDASVGGIVGGDTDRHCFGELSFRSGHCCGWFFRCNDRDDDGATAAE